MNILITGATGLVGSHLLDQLIENEDYNISILTRDAAKAKKELLLPIKIYEWNLEKDYIDPESIKNQDIIIHLAGENVSSRWNKKTKDEILNSRTKSSELILRELEKYPSQKTKIIQASAIGIYGDRGDESLDENSKHADTFLADVCKKWEASVLESKLENIQKYVLRIGIVLSTDGGALKKIYDIFKYNIGGKLASGKQYMSWIHIDDLVNQINYLIKNNPKDTIYNAVSPNPVTNDVFTKTLGKVSNKLTIFPVPKFAVRLVAGEMSDIVLASQKVQPKNFENTEFKFKFSNLNEALANLLRYELKGEGLLLENQFINKPLEEVFEFFSEAKNLEKITPEYLNFKVLGMNTPEIQKGSIINYKLKLRGIPFRWKTLISRFEKNIAFIDQQQKGPYKKWVHTHTFHKIGNGTLIRDHVVYKLPLGSIGRLFAGNYVKKDVNHIFHYRKLVIEDIFKKGN